MKGRVQPNTLHSGLEWGPEREQSFLTRPISHISILSLTQNCAKTLCPIKILSNQHGPCQVSRRRKEPRAK